MRSFVRHVRARDMLAKLGLGVNVGSNNIIYYKKNKKQKKHIKSDLLGQPSYNVREQSYHL
jgi:hypothetical protein